MDHTYADEKSLKSLEDLAVYLGAGRLSLKTLLIAQIQSIKIGIMPDDMNQRASNLVNQLQHLCKLYEDQLQDTLELLPEDFNAVPVIERLKRDELKIARSMTRNPRVKKDG